MATVKTPVPGINAIVAGVEFKDGQASVDDEGLLAYFIGAGYDVQGAEGFEVLPADDRPAPALGTLMGSDVPQSPLADAMDSRNDLVPVGGVKDDGTVVAGANDGQSAAVDPSAPVQESSNPDDHAAVPSTATPSAAAIPPAGLAASDGTANSEPVGSIDTASSDVAPVDAPSDPAAAASTPSDAVDSPVATAPVDTSADATVVGNQPADPAASPDPATDTSADADTSTAAPVVPDPVVADPAAGSDGQAADPAIDGDTTADAPAPADASTEASS